MRAFLAVADQWRCAPRATGGTLWLGLDPAAVEAGWRLAGIAPDPDLWADVQTIAAGAKAALNGR